MEDGSNRAAGAGQGRASDEIAQLLREVCLDAFWSIQRLSPSLSGTEVKVLLYLSRIVNPLTFTSESSQTEIAEVIDTSERQVRRALESLERNRIAIPGKRTGSLRTVYHLLFLETTQIASNPTTTPVKMSGMDPVKMSGTSATPVKMSGMDPVKMSGTPDTTPVKMSGTSDATPVKMSGMDPVKMSGTAYQAPLVHGEDKDVSSTLARTDALRADDSRVTVRRLPRARADLIDLRDLKSIEVKSVGARESSGAQVMDLTEPNPTQPPTVLDVVFGAAPSDFDPELIAKASGLMHSYSARFGRQPYANAPDAAVVARFLAVAEWPVLHKLIYDLIAERKEPGYSPAWFITVALNRIHGIAPARVRKSIEELRRGTGLRTVPTEPTAKGLTGEQSGFFEAADKLTAEANNRKFFADEISKIAKAKGMK